LATRDVRQAILLSKKSCTTKLLDVYACLMLALVCYSTIRYIVYSTWSDSLAEFLTPTAERQQWHRNEINIAGARWARIPKGWPGV